MAKEKKEKKEKISDKEGFIKKIFFIHQKNEITNI